MFPKENLQINIILIVIIWISIFLKTILDFLFSWKYDFMC